MTSNTCPSYQQLHDHFERVSHLTHVQSITSWDESAMMPAGGGPARGAAMATLSVVIHELLTEPKIADWIEQAQSEPLTDWQRANLRESARVYREATCMPADLVAAQATATSASEQAWRECRAANDWQGITGHLKHVVKFSREEAAVRAEASGLGLYDALLDTYEPGVRSGDVATVFSELKTFLPGLVDRIIDQQAGEPPLPMTGQFKVSDQKALGEIVMAAIGFDFNHGRLDVSHHPFCGGVPDDVRITTRYDEDNFVSALMGIIHETGHAMYEQGLPADWRSQPVGLALSSGTHESQSLLMEMQACRTKEFFRYLAPKAQQAFLGAVSNDPVWSPDNLFKLYTRVERSLIRVDADEVTYPLHVILRFEIEKALIEGDLEVEDLPDAWNEKMQDYLKLDTRGDYQNGCLQDVHWPAGLFGYFPTYTLGAMTAAQLFSAIKQERGELMQEIEQGDFSGLVAWLREHIHSQGKYLDYDGLMVAATGRRLEVAPFRKHLETRYLS